MVVMEAMGGDGGSMRDGLAKQEFNTMLDEGSTEVSYCTVIRAPCCGGVCFFTPHFVYPGLGGKLLLISTTS